MPKGLLGLGEILDEYICLKEQRVLVDQEKRRVETAMQGMQEVMRSYHSSINASLPSSPPLLPPQFVASTPTGPALPPLYPSNGSPSGMFFFFSDLVLMLFSTGLTLTCSGCV